MYNRIKEWEGSGSQKSITFVQGGLSVQGEGRGMQSFFFCLRSSFSSRGDRMTNAIQSAVYRPHRDLVWKESIREEVVTYSSSSF